MTEPEVPWSYIILVSYDFMLMRKFDGPLDDFRMSLVTRYQSYDHTVGVFNTEKKHIKEVGGEMEVSHKTCHLIIMSMK